MLKGLEEFKVRRSFFRSDGRADERADGVRRTLDKKRSKKFVLGSPKN